jgi:hypothetical protein
MDKVAGCQINPGTPGNRQRGCNTILLKTVKAVYLDVEWDTAWMRCALPFVVWNLTKRGLRIGPTIRTLIFGSHSYLA